MNEQLLKLIGIEEERGKRKWGHVDITPADFMIAIQEEIGEVAHAINHKEGKKVVQHEIAEVIALLSRLYKECEE